MPRCAFSTLTLLPGRKAGSEGRVGRPGRKPGPCYTRCMAANRDRPLVGVGVVFVRRGRVFLARRRGELGGGSWGSAGGHLEFGETLEQCACREAVEEFGVAVGNLRLLCVSNIVAYGRHYLDVEFLGDIGDQEPQLLEPDAFEGSGWFPLDSPPEPLFEAMRLAIDSLRTGRGYYSGTGTRRSNLI